MRFFIDNNLSKQMADGMAAFGEEVEHLRDSFRADARDEDWLPYVGENEMVLVTRDEAIRRKPAELRALKSHNVGAFFLGGKNLDRCKLIQQLVRNWPRMKEYAAKTRRPFAFRIRATGTKIVEINL